MNDPEIIAEMERRVAARLDATAQESKRVLIQHGGVIDNLQGSLVELDKINRFFRTSVIRKLNYVHAQTEQLEEIYQDLRIQRAQPAYQAAFTQPRPLVSILLPTFNRAKLLTERSLPSVLAQTYENIEVIIVGDGCTDDTEERVRRFDDPRVRFENLAFRGPYPRQGEERWCVAGLYAANRCRELATGLFVAGHDDDDEMLPEKIETLVRLAQEHRAEVIHHAFESEMQDGTWKILGDTPEFDIGRVTTVSVFTHAFFAKKITGDVNSFRYFEPGDWNRFRKIQFLRPRIHHLNKVLVKHYRERGANAHAFTPHETFIDD